MLTKIFSLVLSVVMLISSVPLDSVSVEKFLNDFEEVAELFGVELDLAEEPAVDITNEMVVEPQATTEFTYNYTSHWNYIPSGCGNSSKAKIYLTYEVVVDGLHTAVADKSVNAGTHEGDHDKNYTWPNQTLGTIGSFYHDKNSSNTLTTAHDTSNVGFWITFPEGNVNYVRARTASVSSNNANYYSTTAVSNNMVSLGNEVYISNKDANTGTDDLVTYTITCQWQEQQEAYVITTNTTTMAIQYIQVDTTQLWNLYSYEKSLNRASSAYESASWTAYQNALTNAENILAGGVDQNTINTAYSNLVSAVTGLNIKVTYNGNGATTGMETVTTPQYYPLYSNVSASATSISTPEYNFATVDLADYSSLFLRGYLCTGWSTSSTATQGSATLTMSANSVSGVALYAAWSPISYTLKYNANPPSGLTSTGNVADQSCSYNVDVTIQQNDYSVANYKFKEWNLKADGSGTTYTPGQVVRNFSSTNGDTINLYAIWEADTVNITLNRNRSKDGIEIEVLTGPTETKAYAFTIGSTVDLTQYKMTAVGYEHLGWATSASATTPNYTTTFTVPNTAQTLHAVWQKKSISVSYTLYDGVLSGSGYTIAGTTVEYQGTVNLPDADQITRTGCNFTGWVASVADANGKTFFNPGENYVVPDAQDGSTITFTANWELRTTTYNFHHNNNASSDYTTTISGQYASALTESFPTPSAMTGYTFTGWYVKDGTGYKPYTKPSNFPADDVDLYAGWSMDALQSAISSVPSDLNSIYQPTGEYYYQETGRLLVNEKEAVAQSIVDATDGVVYTYDQLIPANTATSELLQAIDSLIETPAHYDTVNEYLKKYNELLDGSHEYSGVFVNKDFFTSESFAEFEKSVEAVVYGKGIKNQAEVDAYAAALKSTYEALQLMGADYSKFNFFVEEALRLNKDLGSGETTLEYIQENTEAVLWYEFGL